jgi:hypothetical protein
VNRREAKSPGEYSFAVLEKFAVQSWCEAIALQMQLHRNWISCETTAWPMSYDASPDREINPTKKLTISKVPKSSVHIRPIQNLRACYV